MYEAREEKRVFREIIERMGYNPDDAYPKSNYDQWLGYFLGMRVLNEDATKWEPVITWTEADNEVPRELPAQEGKVAFDQFMADGSYVVERSEAIRATTWAIVMTSWALAKMASRSSWPTRPGRARRCRANWRSTASTRPTT